MNSTDLGLNGPRLFVRNLYLDSRGSFTNLWDDNVRTSLGWMKGFAQWSISSSTKGVIRGLHYQLPSAQAKIITVIYGEVFDVIVDLRRSSATFGKFTSLYLNDKKSESIFIPPGFAHGFQAVSDEAKMLYGLEPHYDPNSERGIIWNDSQLAIPWPLEPSEMSVKDRCYPTFASAIHYD